MPAPKVTALADGKGFKIVHDRGADYVFLADQPFTYAATDVSFEGLAGVAQLRGGQPVLELAGSGTITAGGKKLRAVVPGWPLMRSTGCRLRQPFCRLTPDARATRVAQCRRLP